MSNHKDVTISKLTKAVIILSIVVVLLLALILFISFTKKGENGGACGVVEEPELLCGNAIQTSAAIEKVKEMYGVSVDYNTGKKLFKANCSACHTVDRVICGPGIRGVFDRIPSDRWFIDYILKRDSLIEIEDPYTLKIREEFGNVDKPDFKYLSEEEVINIAVYIMAYS